MHDFHLLTDAPQPATAPNPEGIPADWIRITFKIRHTPEYHLAWLEPIDQLVPEEGGKAIIHSDEKIHGVAPGQFCVVYDENHHKCYGSAEIFIE